MGYWNLLKEVTNIVIILEVGERRDKKMTKYNLSKIVFLSCTTIDFKKLKCSKIFYVSIFKENELLYKLLLEIKNAQHSLRVLGHSSKNQCKNEKIYFTIKNLLIESLAKRLIDLSICWNVNDDEILQSCL